MRLFALSVERDSGPVSPGFCCTPVAGAVSTPYPRWPWDTSSALGSAGCCCLRSRPRPAPIPESHPPPPPPRPPRPRAWFLYLEGGIQKPRLGPRVCVLPCRVTAPLFALVDSVCVPSRRRLQSYLGQLLSSWPLPGGALYTRCPVRSPVSLRSVPGSPNHVVEFTVWC